MKTITKIMSDGFKINYNQASVEELIKMACDKFNVEFDKILRVKKSHTTSSVYAIIFNKSKNQLYQVRLSDHRSHDRDENIGLNLTEDNQKFTFATVDYAKTYNIQPINGTINFERSDREKLDVDKCKVIKSEFKFNHQMISITYSDGEKIDYVNYDFDDFAW